VIEGGQNLGALVANATVEIVSITAWVFLCCLPYFYAMHYFGVLRITDQMEDSGIDESAHGGNAYPDLFHFYAITDKDAEAAGPHSHFATSAAAGGPVPVVSVPVAPAGGAKTPATAAPPKKKPVPKVQ
jgi:hypothetical protein